MLKQLYLYYFILLNGSENVEFKVIENNNIEIGR